MENQNKHLLHVVVGVLSGLLIGVGVMYAGPLQGLGNANGPACVQALATQVSSTQTLSYSGVVLNKDQNSYSAYSAAGDLYRFTVNANTKYLQITDQGTRVVSSYDNLQPNSYASATTKSATMPYVAETVTFKVFPSAPYPYVPKMTSTGTGGTGTTPAGTSGSGTTSAGTGMTSTSTGTGTTSSATSGSGATSSSNTLSSGMTSTSTSGSGTTSVGTSSGTGMTPTATQTTTTSAATK